jgi:hypothetical protein
VERIQRTYTVPATRDGFLAALASPEFVRRRSEAVGLGTRVVTLDAGAEGHEEWVRDGDGARSPLTFAFSGMPVTCGGEARLTPVGTVDGGECRLDIELSVRVAVPLVGGLVERAVGPQVGRALDDEAEFYRVSVGQPPSDG